jgi:hypothetical protein
MSRQEMACAKCCAPLNILGNPPSYIHPLSFTTDGHQPQPVPAQELETIARRCDFCGHDLPVWTIEAADTVAVVAYDHAGGGLAQDYGHAWAACAPCEQLTANRDLDGLAARAAAAMGWKHDDQATGHIAQLHAAFLNQSPTRRRLITTTAWPPGAIPARELPKVRDRLVRLYQGGDQLPAPYTDKLRRRLADGLLAARLYWIDPEFTTLADHAAAHLPDHSLSPDQAPADSGLLVWAQPVTDRQTAAASWAVDAGTGSCRIVCYRHIGTGLGGPVLQRVREQVGWLVPTRLVEAAAGQVLSAGGPAAPLVATWLLIAQKAAETVPVELDRATRRAYGRQQRPVPEVRVVRIRARAANPSRVRGSGRGPLTRREWVGGHWRNQACGPKRGQRRLIYVHPYIRGPEGAELRAATTVRVLGNTRNPTHPTTKKED